MNGDGRSPAVFWEEHYGAREQVWSGRANPVLVDVAGRLEPGTALDLGCGEGGDAVWLAHRGWRVTAVDISTTALRRAVEHATAEGVADRIAVERHELGETFPAGSFDLVSAQFLQSPVAFPRLAVLRAAAAAVAPGGLLLIVEHASGPSWAPPGHHHMTFPTPEGTWAELALDQGEWRAEIVATRTRESIGPAGQRGELADGVVAARRAT